MKFQFLSENLWSIAKTLIKYYEKKTYRRISFEKPLAPQYQFKPALVCHKRGSAVLVIEIQEKPQLQEYFETFVKECLINQERIEIFLAFPHSTDDKETSFSHSFLTLAKKYGLGILLVCDNNVIVHRNAVQCNMRIGEAEMHRPGRYRKDIVKICEKFNEGNFIDAIRDITELIEGLVDTLAEAAARAKKIVPTIGEVQNYNFETKIKLLSAPNWRNKGGARKKQKKYFDVTLCNDLISYKGVRNLSHHPRNRYEKMKLERQFLDRMYTGIRLVREVSNIKA